jgi:hypothetical protein
MAPSSKTASPPRQGRVGSTVSPHVAGDTSRVQRVHHFIIEPLKGVGPIRFGMHKDEVSRVFPYPYTSFFHTPDSKVRADHCEAVGLYIYYDDASRVNAVQIRKPRGTLVTLELFGNEISGISVGEFAEFLRKHGVRGEKSPSGVRGESISSGYEFPDIGLSTFNGDLRSETEAIECLYVILPTDSE